MFYSAKTNGLYDDPSRYPDVPDDLKEIPDDLYQALMAGNAEGKNIVPGKDGLPTLASLELSVDEKNKFIELKRLNAYANPITGSDRFFAEASSLSATGATQEEIDKVVSQGKARYEEIKSQYPWSNA